MHKCTKSGLYGHLQASIAIDDGPIFNHKNINEASLEARLSFAKTLNKLEDKAANVNIGEYIKDNKNIVSEGKHVAKTLTNAARTPEAVLPKQVFGRADKKMSQWDAYYKRAFLPKFQRIEGKYAKMAATTKDAERLKAIELRKQKELGPVRAEAEKSYRELLSKQFGTAKNQIQEVFNQHAENPKKLDAELKKMGLTRSDAYFSHQYLGYLENGGPFFNFNPGSNSKVLDGLTERINTVTGNKVKFNPMTALYNVTEFVQKAPAVAGPVNTLHGIVEAHKAATAAKLTIFDRLPALERKGVYASDYTPLRPEGKLDPVARSQNMLDNLAYYTGQKMGNVPKAMKEIAYRPKPWNDTFALQDPRAKSLLNFMSFQFRHMQQYGGWVRDITPGLNSGVPKARIGQSAKALAAYSLATGVIFGNRAAIPAPIYELAKAADPELDSQIKSVNSIAGPGHELLDTGLVGVATGGHVDLTKYARPLGGIAVGVGGDMVNTAQDTATHIIPKAAKEAREGRPDKAALVAVDGITQLSQLLSHGAPALVQKTISGVTKAYLDDEDFAGYVKEVQKKYFGSDSIAK